MEISNRDFPDQEPFERPLAESAPKLPLVSAGAKALFRTTSTLRNEGGVTPRACPRVVTSHDESPSCDSLSGTWLGAANRKQGALDLKRTARETLFLVSEIVRTRSEQSPRIFHASACRVLLLYADLRRLEQNRRDVTV